MADPENHYGVCVGGGGGGGGNNMWPNTNVLERNETLGRFFPYISTYLCGEGGGGGAPLFDPPLRLLVVIC